MSWQRKGIEYRYLLGGRLLIDMEEQPEENTLSIKECRRGSGNRTESRQERKMRIIF